MAFNYDANQYEKAFNPTKLCNWETPIRSPIKPKLRKGSTKIIVNEKGHLLPGIKKITPWTGTYKAMCQLSNSTSKTSNQELDHSTGILTSWEKRSSHVPVIENSIPPSSVPLNAETENQKSSSIVEKESNENDKNTLSSPAEQIESDNQHCPVIKSTESEQESEKDNNENNMKTDQQIPGSSRKSTKNSLNEEPLLTTAYCNRVIARNLKFHNQKHHMLADAVDCPSTKQPLATKLVNSHENSLLDIDLENNESTPAVGCKVFQSPGPTQCSKLKIFRPKTAVISTDRKENSIYCETFKTPPKNKPLSEMDLAIYWDVSIPNKNNTNVNKNITENKNTDSKPETSIIQHQEDNNKAILPIEHETGNNDDKLQVVDLDGEKNEIQNIEEKNQAKLNTETGSVRSKNIKLSDHSMRPHSAKQSTSRKHKSKRNCTSVRRGSSTNLTQIPEIRAESSSLPLRSEKLYASAPNLMDVGIQVNGSNFKLNVRTCDACIMKQPQSRRHTNTDLEKYKPAFKAGKPNALTIDKITQERIHNARHLRVPKPKIPFAKKNYTIGTLVPPFSIWPRAAGHDYPDHWRLVTVYQHSYKPMDTRKVPLMKTVFQ